MSRPIPRRLLNARATIGRASTASDSQGGHARTYPAIKTDVRCRIRPLTTPEITVGAREEVRATHRIYFLPDEDVRRDDQITIGSRVYSVIFPREPSETRHHQEVDAKETRLAGQA